MAVLSGKGGTGKTTVCAGLALELAGSGLPGVVYRFGRRPSESGHCAGDGPGPALSFPDVSEGGASLLEAARHPGCEALLSDGAGGPAAGGVGSGSLCPDDGGGPADLDICLLDAPAGVGDGFRMAAQAASLELLGQGRIRGPAGWYPDRGASGAYGQAGRAPGGQPGEPEALQRHEPDSGRCDGYGRLPPLGLVPEDRSVPLAAVHDRPLLHYARRSPAAAAFHRMAKRLQGIPAPLARLK